MLIENKPIESSITLEHGRMDMTDLSRMDPDLPRRLTRSARIVVLGGMVGAMAGCLWLLSQAPTFRSAAQMQVVGQGNARGAEAIETAEGYGSPLSDEVFVIRSERILRQAAEIGELDQTVPFFGQTYEEIASALKRSEALVVTPVAADVRTNVIRVHFDALDAMTPERVVQAVVDAYTRYTHDRFKKGDDQAASEIHSARDTAAARLRELEREYDEFKQRTDLLFVDGQPKSTHRNTADRLLAQREELLVGKTEIASKLSVAEDSLKRGDSPSTVLLALRGESETPSDVIDRGISDRLQKIREESQSKPSDRLLETNLLPLQLERKDLLENVGAKHPTIVSIDKKISVVEMQIERMQAKEKQKETMIAKAMSVRGDVGDLDPQAEIKRRVDLALSAMRQRLDSAQQQIAAIDEAYAEESEAAKREIAAERESLRLERDLTRQAEYYERILARVDDVQLAAEQGLTVIPLDEAGPGTPRRQAAIAMVHLGWGDRHAFRIPSAPVLAREQGLRSGFEPVDSSFNHPSGRAGPPAIGHCTTQGDKCHGTFAAVEDCMIPSASGDTIQYDPNDAAVLIWPGK